MLILVKIDKILAFGQIFENVDFGQKFLKTLNSFKNF